MAKEIIKVFLIIVLGHIMQRVLPKYSTYIYFLAILLASWQLFLSLSKNNRINYYLIRFRESMGSKMTYFIVAIFGAALASGYWWGIQKAFVNQKFISKELSVKQNTERKTKIINQLNQFVRNGNALLLQIGNAHSSQFPSKFPLPKNMKPFPMELEIANWSKDVYNYLIVDVRTWAEYYHNLSTRDIIINHKPYTTPQERYRASMITIMGSRIDRIIEIIKYVDRSGN